MGLKITPNQAYIDPLAVLLFFIADYLKIKKLIQKGVLLATSLSSTCYKR